MRLRRKLWLVVLSLPVLLVGAHYAYWRIASAHLEKGLAVWLAQRQRAGWSNSIGTPVRGGYPLAATLTVPDVTLHGGGDNLTGDLAWTAARVVLRVALAQPHLLSINAEGAQRLRLGQGPDIPFRTDRLGLLLPLDPGFPHWLDFSVAQLRAGLPAGETAAGLLAREFWVHADLRPAAPQGEPAITFAVRAEAIHLPGHVYWAFGPDIARIAIGGTVGGPLPRGGSPTQAAAQWRDGGGTVEIGDLRAQWGPLEINTSAVLALDEQLQPMGSGSAHFKGPSAALDALVAAGMMTPAVATMTRTMIALFAPARTGAGTGAQSGAAADANADEAETPFTLQDRRLFARQLPLGRLPALAWPDR